MHLLKLNPSLCFSPLHQANQPASVEQAMFFFASSFGKVSRLIEKQLMNFTCIKGDCSVAMMYAVEKVIAFMYCVFM